MKEKKILLWFVPFCKEIKPISDIEKERASNLSKERAEEYAFSRGYMRDVLSKLFGISALEVPLESFPGKPPLLKGGLGNISISHCKDALLIGWSNNQIGVDIERTDRKLKFKNISERYFLEEEKKELAKLSGEKLRLSILNLWVLKEASIKCQKGTIIKDLPLWKINQEYSSAFHKILNISLNIFYLYKESWILGVAHDSRNLNHDEIGINFL